MNYAANTGNLEIINMLVIAKNIGINQANEKGWSPLYQAASKGHVEVVKLLLQSGEIEINYNDWNLNSDFYQAAKRNDPAILKLFVDHCLEKDSNSLGTETEQCLEDLNKNEVFAAYITSTSTSVPDTSQDVYMQALALGVLGGIIVLAYENLFPDV